MCSICHASYTYEALKMLFVSINDNKILIIIIVKTMCEVLYYIVYYPSKE